MTGGLLEACAPTVFGWWRTARFSNYEGDLDDYAARLVLGAPAAKTQAKQAKTPAPAKSCQEVSTRPSLQRQIAAIEQKMQKFSRLAGASGRGACRMRREPGRFMSRQGD